MRLTDSCLMVSLEKSMEGLALSRSASSSSLYGVTLVLEGLLLRGVMDPGERSESVMITSKRLVLPSVWSAATANSWV